MKKEFIQNRKGQKISVLIEEAKNQKGLVFVMHGLGGTKNENHIETFASAFREKNFTVIRFDTTNTVGESAGNMADATLTNYFEDLEDVIQWSSSQAWYAEPFVLCGHSLGGICSALYTQKYPQKVKALSPISTVVSGKYTEEAPDFKNGADEWEKKGIKEWESKSFPGMIKKLKWSHVIDRRKYNLLPEINKLTMPVLLIVGELDDITPAEHQKILYDALTGQKELHIIKGAEHTFRKEEHLAEIKEIFLKWIDTL
jgi:uncharacterized protein